MGCPQGVAALGMCSLALAHGQALRTLFATGYCDKAISLFAMCEGRSTGDVDVVVSDGAKVDAL